MRVSAAPPTAKKVPVEKQGGGALLRERAKA